MVLFDANENCAISIYLIEISVLISSISVEFEFQFQCIILLIIKLWKYMNIGIETLVSNIEYQYRLWKHRYRTPLMPIVDDEGGQAFIQPRKLSLSHLIAFKTLRFITWCWLWIKFLNFEISKQLNHICSLGLHGKFAKINFPINLQRHNLPINYDAEIIKNLELLKKHFPDFLSQKNFDNRSFVQKCLK